MPIIAVSNQKGGVGKTTSTLNLGAALQGAGKRVLLVDLDPQGNLSVAAGLLQPEALSPSIGDLLVQAARPGAGIPNARAAIVRSPAGLDIIPANSQLSAAELALVSAISRESALHTVLLPLLPDYDFVLMDCLPSLSLLVVNAFTAADGIIIPVQADYLAMQGLAQVMETIAAVQTRLNPQLQIFGILLTMVDQRTSHSREVVSTIRQAFADQIRVFDAEIRLHVVLKDSTKAGLSIREYDPQSAGAIAYDRLAAELIEFVDSRGPTTPRNQRAAAAAVVLPSFTPPPPTPPAPLSAPAPEAEAPVATLSPEAPPIAEPVPEPPVARSRTTRTEPLRFAEFLAGRDGWLGRGDQ